MTSDGQIKIGRRIFVCQNKFGIIVIGRNEGNRLVRCLESIRHQADCVIYVDSGSSDSSVSVAIEAGVRLLELDGSETYTAARARNAGFKAMRSYEPDIEFVQFVDGDCELAPTWIERSIAFIRDRPDVAVVCGRRREKYPERSIYNRMIDLEWNTPIGEASACGGDALMKVSAFEVVGGFRSQLIAGEEPEYCSRLRQKGWRVWRLDAEMTTHDAAITRFSQFWRRAVRSGYAEADISCHYFGTSLATTEMRQIARTIFWAALMPAALLVGALFKVAILLGFGVYPIQVCRIALRRGVRDWDSWLYAYLITVAKFAQLQGLIQHLWARCRNASLRPIEYKAR